MSISNNMNVQLQDINKPAINAAHVREKDRIIKSEHIKRVGCLNIFGDNNINKAIQWHCRWVLNAQATSKNFETYLDFDNGIIESLRYAEVAILVSTYPPYSRLVTCYGDYKHVEISNKAIEMFSIVKDNRLVTIHNHPGGGGLSWSDILQFIRYDQVISQIVVTNHGRVFQMTKQLYYDKNKMLKEIDKLEQKHNPGHPVKKYSPEYYKIARLKTLELEGKLFELGILYTTVG